MSYTYKEEDGFWRTPLHEKFAYSDGDATERDIMARLTASKDRSALSQELLNKIHGWPTQYHFHPARANLLRPHESRLRGASVLELGGGCGALTRYLGETCAGVVMVEGSARRCAIAARRCRGLDNVSIYCDNIMRADPPGAPFDVVTLIGVLEYARLYDTENEDPIQAMLERAGRLLAPGGFFLLALENQFGLKYFAGANEDHLNLPMLGVNNVYDERGIVTFGVREMAERLRGAGFASLRQYLPFPDYKMPRLIVHPEARGVPPSEFRLGDLIAECTESHNSPLFNNFSLERSWNMLARNDLAWDLCHSLYFMARVEEEPEREETGGDTTLAEYYSMNRKVQFMKRVAFVRSDGRLLVRRTEMAPRKSAPEEVLRNSTLPEEPYYPYVKYSEGLSAILNRRGWSAARIALWGRKLLRFWEKRAVVRNGVKLVPSSMMDCIARNILIAPDGSLAPIDQEWRMVDEHMPLSFIAFYNLLISLQDLYDVEIPEEGTPLGLWPLAVKVMQGMGVRITQQETDEFVLWLRRFIKEATGPQIDEPYKNQQLRLRYAPAEMHEVMQDMLKLLNAPEKR